ncbi:uncharacterized protein LOC113504637 [Trichoplusia ni]|uniref:Uncharacterized protein LOC113504637 n=1 Tax=Trichoplusia ni TaxID=7111 RepID=A0A7E5WQ36_TRINI|nr:uncharacterized protein LOC113504637 [Trichoplusia ni]
MWRGCPTQNKFQNEFLCTLNCIFRMVPPTPEITTLKTTPEPPECQVPMNTGQCRNETVTVFTHVSGKCIEAGWGGCETRNKFETKYQCDVTCETHQQLELEKELNNLSQEALETFNEILHVIEEEITTDLPTTATRESEPLTETEAETEAQTETDSPEVETTAETTTNLDFEEVVNT